MDTLTSSARSSVTAGKNVTGKPLEGVPVGSPGASTPEHDAEMGLKDEKDSVDSNLVTWDDLDPENPHNWKPSKKLVVTAAMGTLCLGHKWRAQLLSICHKANLLPALMTCVVTFASSVFSPASVPTAHEFGVSTEVMTLGTSLFVAVRCGLEPSRSIE